MRDILFRAKKIKDNEWIEGHFAVHPKGNCSISVILDKCKNPPDSDPMWQKVLISHEVYPETVCQYTGLTDKNGKKIWENDIVKFDIYEYDKLVSSTISDIKWCEELCSLSVVVNERGTRGTLGHFNDSNKTVEVIGNIFDKPELLN